MIRFTTDEGVPTCVADLAGRVGVYLDNDSLIEFAKGDASLRQRFVSAVRQRGRLLFSFTNAIEVSGPTGASATAVRDFLDSIGACWIPLALNPWQVADREAAGLGAQAVVSENFITAFFKERAYQLSPAGAAILDLSPDKFFRLSAVVDWAQQDRSGIKQRALNIDEALRNRIAEERKAFKADPASLDISLPAIEYQPSRPATFVLIHLLRILVKEAKAFQFVPHDGLDLCHAVMGAGHAHIATLDKGWKRRVDQIPGPHGLAEIYYRPQVADLTQRLEALVAAG